VYILQLVLVVVLRAAGFAAKPVRNAVGGQVELLQRKVAPPVQTALSKYSQAWVPKKLKELREKEKNGKRK
jgi:hypothetical protein